MESKDRLLKRIADFFLTFVAILGLISIFPEAREKFSVTDILTITLLLFFISFVVLITLHVSKLEEKINKLDETLNIENRFSKIEQEISKIKRDKK
jgi:ABC-type polysaccharide/polyol phosphate export permease